jgi:hypothetical protein
MLLEKVSLTPFHRRNSKFFFVLSILLTCSNIFLLLNCKQTPYIIEEKERAFSLPPTAELDTLSKETVYNYLQKIGVLFPEVALAQALLETGHFSSYSCISRNNLFGMKKPYRRDTYAIDFDNGYSIYSCWQYSCLDYKLWQEFLFDKYGVPEDYYLFLHKMCYAEDPNYVSKLMSFKIE